ncbi:hypothetical protein AGJ34_20780 [Cronobacter dublinensis subsp. dublinensis]|nr:hypothetical protein [Cronobacter dublinensis subsp. dublinensis]EGT5729696.1 hypothetical protein [Cronobacter dublinensis subsp. dublinensis]
MITITLNANIEEALKVQARKEESPETQIYNRWAKLGKLAEEHPDMLAGDLIAYLKAGEYPSTSLADAPSQPGCRESDNASLRMMMKVLVYTLHQRCPDHKNIVKAMDLMKRLGMYKMSDILR